MNQPDPNAELGLKSSPFTWNMMDVTDIAVFVMNWQSEGGKLTTKGSEAHEEDGPSMPGSHEKYKSYKGTVGKIAPNHLDRQFTAGAPNEKWVTDITEFKLFGEKLYLSPILDLFNGEIITYTMGSRPTYSLVSEMLDAGLKRLPEEHQLLLHSDQGWHYQMKPYRHALKSRGILQSMSRKGNCYDNAVIENFFGILKSEFLYYKEFESVEHFKEELKIY